MVEQLNAAMVSVHHAQWSSDDGVAMVSINATKHGLSPRVCYMWTVKTNNTILQQSSPSNADAIFSGVGDRPNAIDGLRSFAGFLSAWVEAGAYVNSDNGSLFPNNMRNFAERYAEEMSNAMLYLGEDKDWT